jgi:lysophospholipase L1-like esterase
MKKYLVLSLALLAACRGDAAETKAVSDANAAVANVAAAAAPVPLRAGETRVAQWQGDKKAVFLLMFDDGWPSHWQVALPELQKRGMIGTFYIVPQKGEYTKFEGRWLKDMLAAGMVFANHTHTHNGFQGKEDTEMEITACTQYLLEKVPGKKPRLISFGLPGVKDYDYGGLDFKALLAKNNLIDRPDFKGHGASYHIKKLEEYVALSDKSIASGGMEYVVYHGLERIEPNWGYQDMWAVPQTVFLPFLDALQERRDRGDLWITDHISWHQYKTERETAKVTMLENSAKQIRLELKSDADSQLYDLPLTLVTGVPVNWTRCRATQGAKKSEMAAHKGQIQFEAVPNGGPVTITPIANWSMQPVNTQAAVSSTTITPKTPATTTSVTTAPADEKPAAPPKSKEDPTIPVSRIGLKWSSTSSWQGTHEEYVKRAKAGNVNLVFFGDSLTHWWDGKDFKKRYVSLGGVNFGIGGDKTQHLLWRIQNGEMDGITPKVDVVLIGTNNLGDDRPEKIADGITKVISAIQEKSPTSKILLLGIFPRGWNANEAKWYDMKISKINSTISKLDDGKNVRYVDFGPKLRDEDGNVSRRIFKDGLHLSGEGYQIWADAMQPILDEMLGISGPVGVPAQ